MITFSLKVCLATAGTNTHGRTASPLPVEWILLLERSTAHSTLPTWKSMEGRMTNGCVGACRLHGCLLAAVCVRACAREHSAAWLCVFACLSHDVLWQSLTNRTGASGGWGGGGETRAWEDAEEGRGAMEPQRGARWLTAVTWGAYNEAKLHSNSWITGQMTHDLT